MAREECHIHPGKPYGAHVKAYKNNKGPIPSGMYVLHSCDNPRCVNPDHLWLGTQKDNIADMIAKGRSTIGTFVGERNGQAKVTEADVIEIKRLLEQGYLQRTVGDLFGLDQSTVSNINTGKRWRYLNA